MATLRCTHAFTTEIDGVPRVVTGGQLVDSDDPVVAGREHLFEAVDTYMARRKSVEEATAAPGEVRTVSTKRGKRSKAE